MRPLGSGYYVFFVICAATLTGRAALDSEFRNSTLLYILIPFAIWIARILDPYWYFGPMEQLARQSARDLIDTIIARKDG